jgi:hypothetical protein
VEGNQASVSFVWMWETQSIMKLGFSIRIRNTLLVGSGCSIHTVFPEIPYLRTPWSRVLLEKLTRPKLLKKFPAFYGTRRFITAFTRARHLSLS